MGNTCLIIRKRTSVQKSKIKAIKNRSQDREKRFGTNCSDNDLIERHKKYRSNFWMKNTFRVTVTI